MARPLRILFKNAYYHVMNRGAARCPTFSRPEHGNLFLALLEDSVARFGLEVLCYCLMSNHYHLLVKTPHANLDRVMRHIDGVYTQRFNRLGNRDGPLFRGRYKAIVIDSENYLISASRYIHRNPIEAGLCKALKQYKWSSYKAYLGEVPKPKWLSIDEILNHMPQQDARCYQDLVENPLLPSMREYNLDDKYGLPIIGTDAFREHAMSLVKHLSKHPEIPEARSRLSRPSLMAVVTSTAEVFGKEKEELLTNSRGKINHARAAAIFLACRKYRYSPSFVAKTFGISYSGVSRSALKFEMRIKNELGAQNLVEVIIGKLQN